MNWSKNKLVSLHIFRESTKLKNELRNIAGVYQNRDQNTIILCSKMTTITIYEIHTHIYIYTYIYISVSFINNINIYSYPYQKCKKFSFQKFYKIQLHTYALYLLVYDFLRILYSIVYA